MLIKIILTIKLRGGKHVGENTNKEKISTIKLSGRKHVVDNTNMDKNYYN